MAYKLNITEHADELLDNLLYHLIYRLKNEQAAEHLAANALYQIEVDHVSSVAFDAEAVKELFG